MKNRRTLYTVIYLVALMLLFSWISGLFTQDVNALPYSKVVELFREEQVERFVVKDQTITLYLNAPYGDETTLVTNLADPEAFRMEISDLLADQSARGILKAYDFIPEKGFSPYQLVMPLLLVGLVLLFLWAMFMGRANSNNPLNSFGKARTTLGAPGGGPVSTPC